uniref:Uncharacterized protein n=1 Tax=Davidia involucrata TaxID=16924 RepID=A0A5B6ZR95_DAVIN
MEALPLTDDGCDLGTENCYIWEFNFKDFNYVKENPQIICVDTIKASPLNSVATKLHARKMRSPTRASSATLTQQKSFKKEPEKPNSTYSLPSRTLRSPSPSRRFSGDNYKGVFDKHCQRKLLQ